MTYDNCPTRISDKPQCRGMPQERYVDPFPEKEQEKIKYFLSVLSRKYKIDIKMVHDISNNLIGKTTGLNMKEFDKVDNYMRAMK